jgi:CheY-like chemotaxis protein
VLPDSNGAEKRGRRILLADDNQDALDSLAALLQCDGHEVHTAADGLEAFELAASWRPEVMLLDIGMPKLDGYEVARRVRAQPWGSDTVLIALTGWGQDEDRRRSQEVGFNSHLVKPLDLDALAKLLARMPAAATA